jgi:hypothetical protein
MARSGSLSVSTLLSILPSSVPRGVFSGSGVPLACLSTSLPSLVLTSALAQFFKWVSSQRISLEV